MSNKNNLRIEHLGQTGLKIDLDDLTILVDPYLSNSVQELEAPDLIRQVLIPYDPNSLTSIDWVLITHDHMDHCDPMTIPMLAKASPNARFLGPLSVRKRLIDWDISENRIFSSSSKALHLGRNLFVEAIPSAHPKIRLDINGNSCTVGYLLSLNNQKIYIAGDTSVCDELINSLKQFGKIDLALLPVNEDNYFRRKRGIIGNMSIREAFALAQELGFITVVPVHWDMFEVNSTSYEEICAVYNSFKWTFHLMHPQEIEL